MNSKESMYSWHLSLRVDRPVEVSLVKHRLVAGCGGVRGLVMPDVEVHLIFAR